MSFRCSERAMPCVNGWCVCVCMCDRACVLFIHAGQDLKLLFIILECDGEQPHLGEEKVGKL